MAAVKNLLVRLGLDASGLAKGAAAGSKSVSAMKKAVAGDAASLSRSIHSVDAQIEKTQKAISKMEDNLAKARSGGLGPGESVNVGEMEKQLYQYGDLMERLKAQRYDLGKQIEGGDEAEDEVRRFTLSTSRLQSALNTAKEAARGFGTGLKGLAGGLLQVGSTAARTAGKLLALPFRRAAAGIQSLRERTSSLGTTVFRAVSLQRLATAGVRLLTSAVREGMENLKTYSAAMGGRFAQSMASISASFTQVKNSVAAVISPLVNALAPAIEYVCARITTLLQLLAQLMAALTGQNFFSVATKSAEGYAKAAGGAGKAQDKFLASFDKLNIIGNKSGGGGGGAAEEAAMFEKGYVSQKIKDFVQEIRDAIDAGGWEAAGALLAEKINGLVGKIDSAKWGRMAGEKLQNGISAALGFLRTIDLGQYGQKVAEFFNGLLSKVDFKDVGALAVRWGTGLIDSILGMIRGLDTGLVGKSISDFFVGAFDEARGWIDGINWRETGSMLYQKIKSFFKGIDWKGLAQGAMELLGAAIGAAASLLGGFIADVVDDIAEYFKKYIEDENGDGQFSGGEIIKGLLKGIWEGIKNIGKWIKENIFEPFIRGFKEAFRIASPSKVMEEMGGYIVDGLFAGISNAWSKITGFFTETVPALIADLRNRWEQAKTDAATKWEEISGTLSGKWETIKANASARFEEVRSKIATAWNSARMDSSAKWEEIKNTLSGKWTEIKGKASSRFEETRKTVQDAWSSVRSDTETRWSEISRTLSDWWDSIERTAGSKWESITETIRGAFSGLRGKLQGVWNSVSSWWDGLELSTPSVSGGYSYSYGGGTTYSNSGRTISAYASGGFPETAELFMARENGLPEMVGQIGSRTAVASNEQIVSAIQGGVAEANYGLIDAIYEGAKLVAQTVRDNGNTYLDGQKVSRTITRRQDATARAYGA